MFDRYVGLERDWAGSIVYTSAFNFLCVYHLAYILNNKAQKWVFHQLPNNVLPVIWPLHEFSFLLLYYSHLDFKTEHNCQSSRKTSLPLLLFSHQNLQMFKRTSKYIVNINLPLWLWEGWTLNTNHNTHANDIRYRTKQEKEIQLMRLPSRS